MLLSFESQYILAINDSPETIIVKFEHWGTIQIRIIIYVRHFTDFVADSCFQSLLCFWNGCKDCLLCELDLGKEKYFLHKVWIQVIKIFKKFLIYRTQSLILQWNRFITLKQFCMIVWVLLKTAGRHLSWIFSALFLFYLKCSESSDQ